MNYTDQDITLPRGLVVGKVLPVDLVTTIDPTEKIFPLDGKGHLEGDSKWLSQDCLSSLQEDTKDFTINRINI